MKLYYHKTDGGAEYYCLAPVKGTEEGDMKTAILRTDGFEVELYTHKCKEYGVLVKVDNKLL